jgi:ectonucleotide pyrophosphatase/phosphodiesterase family protein 5
MFIYLFSILIVFFFRLFIRLVTGLYEEVHGLISDQIYDPKTNSIFQSWENMTSQWWPIKSIWTINEQRLGARSGVIGWPQYPIVVSKYEAYQKKRSYKDIIDQMLSWFNDSIEPINFGAIYFQEPALTGKLILKNFIFK